MDRTGNAARRAAAMKGKPRVRGLDRDEMPPAIAKEGGASASVKHIDPHDNRGSGASLGAQLRDLKDGDTFSIDTSRASK